MKFFELLVATLLYLYLVDFPTLILCECSPGRVISLYNIGTGYLSYLAEGNIEVKSAYASVFENGDRPARASWTLIDNSDGSVSFSNLALPSHCLRHDYRWITSSDPLIADSCDIENDDKFKFELRLHNSGALQIVRKGTERCVFDNGEGVWYGMYSDDCKENDRKFLWAFVPPYKIDS